MKRVLGMKQFMPLLAVALIVAGSVLLMGQYTGGVRQAEVRAEAGYAAEVLLCGDLGNNTTLYTSPVSGFATGAAYNDDSLTATDATVGYNLGNAGCSAEDNTTEATADEVMYADNAFKVLGMYCAVSGSGSNGVTINLRSAAGNLTPNITVTIPTAKTTAVSNAFTTTDVAAGATFAARAITTEDLSAQDFWCLAKILVMP